MEADRGSDPFPPHTHLSPAEVATNWITLWLQRDCPGSVTGNI